LLRRGRTADFERRSTLYVRVDAQLCDHTRFFAAAAWVNAALARLFEVWPAFRTPRSLQFLDQVGAALEIDNLAYAQQISGRATVGRLDHELVCAEQRRLQRYVRAHQLRRPQHWEAIRAELNALLNDRYAASIFARRFEASAGLCAALSAVRGPSRLQLDFADESHRILIGLKLIEQVRAGRPSAFAYGASGGYLTDGAPRS
jgi:hypothetical protein